MTNQQTDQFQITQTDLLKSGASLYLNEIQSIQGIKELFFEKTENITILKEKIFNPKLTTQNYRSFLIIGPTGCGKSVTVEHMINSIPNTVSVMLNCKYDAAGSEELLQNIYNQLKLKVPGFWNENKDQIQQYYKQNTLYAIKYILFNLDAPIFLVFDEFDAAYETYNNSMAKHALAFFSNIYEGFVVKGSENNKPINVTSLFLTNKPSMTSIIAPDMYRRITDTIALQHYDELDLTNILKLRVNYCFQKEYTNNINWTKTIAHKANKIMEGDSRTSIRLLKTFTTKILEENIVDFNNEELINEALLTIETEDLLRFFDSYEEDKKIVFWKIICIVSSNTDELFSFEQILSAYRAYCLTHSPNKEKHERTIRYYLEDMEEKNIIQNQKTGKKLCYKYLPDIKQTIKFLKRKGYGI